MMHSPKPLQVQHRWGAGHIPIIRHSTLCVAPLLPKRTCCLRPCAPVLPGLRLLPSSVPLLRARPRKSETTPEPEDIPEEDIERLTGELSYSELQKSCEPCKAEGPGLAALPACLPRHLRPVDPAALRAELAAMPTEELTKMLEQMGENVQGSREELIEHLAQAIEGDMLREQQEGGQPDAGAGDPRSPALQTQGRSACVPQMQQFEAMDEQQLHGTVRIIASLKAFFNFAPAGAPDAAV
ncbi:hypothetical protein DUNSADRAFT_8167 [Dunaliella salina]|uniref:SAP domain-containing protein n=1 Tax=Dunaliella salina TaxID=3046 RepID=A0ABQ7GJX0_DUNSA|nr:hypothetical protein DUNSADRAFT_8167 [Dunaliella salina]|eukprot:KAF5834896.1 hypothetical protein DUNSADRAFT_8167 [Dunaliella salina]